MSDIPPPAIQMAVPIVNPSKGTMTEYFANWLIRVLTQIINQVNTSAATLAALQAANAASQSAQQAAAAAQAAAAQAQATADAGGGSPTARSGNATTTFDVGFGWSNGPQVNLLTVSAGNLTIQGSGPQQTGSTDCPQGTFNGQWRIREITPGPVETTVFTGDFQAVKSYDGEFGVSIVDLYNQTDTSAVSLARVSTGSVSYRLDLQMLTGVTVTNVQAVLYVRRS